jgi:hypothetical protein
MTYVFGVWHKFPRQTSWTPQVGWEVIGINFKSDHIFFFCRICPFYDMNILGVSFQVYVPSGIFSSRIHQFWDIYLHVEYVLQIRSCTSIYPPQTDAISGVQFMFCICWRLQFWKLFLENVHIHIRQHCNFTGSILSHDEQYVQCYGKIIRLISIL